MHSKCKQKKHREDAPDARSKKFEAERRKYSLLLAQVMINAQLSVVALIHTLDDANSALDPYLCCEEGQHIEVKVQGLEAI